MYCNTSYTLNTARLLELADLIVEIPTYGVKNSLNVAAAAPIVLYEVLRQYNSDKGHNSDHLGSDGDHSKVTKP